MSPISVIRICAFLVVLTLSSAYTDTQLYNIVIFFGLGHYILSVIYARKNLMAIASRPAKAASFTGVLGAGWWLYISQFNLQLLFLPHHVFNEVYSTKKEILLPNSQPQIKALTGAGMLLNTVLYMQILNTPQLMGWYWLEENMTPLIWLSTCVFIVCLLRVQRLIGWKRTFDACCFEAIAFVVLYSTRFVPVNFFSVVLYHFVFWAAYPLSNFMAQKNSGATRSYVLTNIAVMAALALVAPFSPLPWRIDADVWSQAFLIGSFLHITSSLAVSRAQPDWIWRLFLPIPKAVSVALGAQQQARQMEPVSSR
jgi:hypothetical protein